MKPAEKPKEPKPKPKPTEKEANDEAQKLAARMKIRELRAQIESEQRLINQFYLEKERLSDAWNKARKENEAKEAQLAYQKRDLLELQEKNAFGLNLYRERVKQVMLLKERNNAERVLEIEGVVRDLEDENRILERELATDNRGVGRELKEHELNHRNFLFNMKLQGDKTSTIIQAEFEKQARDMKAKFDLKMHKIRAEMEEYSAKRVAALEESKDEKIKELTVFHNNKYRDIKNYYADITTTNLAKIKDLKGEIQIAQMADEKDRKLLLKSEETFKRLSEPLRLITDEINRLKEDRIRWKAVKEEKRKRREMIADLEHTYRELEYEYEIKFQQYQFLEDECSRISGHFDGKVEEIYQKAGLKNLILENQLKLLKNTLETRDFEIKNVLLNCGLAERDRTELEEYVRRVTQERAATISSLQQQIIDIRRAHLQVVAAYQAKMREHKVPLNELGFLPRLPNLVVGEANKSTDSSVAPGAARTC